MWKSGKYAKPPYPLKLRVTHRRKPKYYGRNYGLDMKLTASELEAILGNPRGENRKKREFLDSFKSHFERIINEMSLQFGPNEFTFGELESRLGRGKEVKTDLLVDALGKYAEGKKSNEHYKYTGTTVKKYAPAITFSAITPKWLEGFEEHLKSKESSQSTIAHHMRHIRAVWNDAKRKNLVKEERYPFGVGKYVIPQTTHSKKLTSKADLQKLISFESDTRYLQFARDVYLFCFFCGGANPIDVFSLKPEDVTEGAIKFMRTKTEVATQIPVIDLLKYILDRYHGGTYLFPVVGKDLEKDSSNARMRINRNLKKIVGHDEISLSHARNSFSSYATLSGMPRPLVSNLMAHSAKTMTEGYMSFPIDDKRKSLDRVLEYLLKG